MTAQGRIPLAQHGATTRGQDRGRYSITLYCNYISGVDEKGGINITSLKCSRNVFKSYYKYILK